MSTKIRKIKAYVMATEKKQPVLMAVLVDNELISIIQHVTMLKKGKEPKPVAKEFINVLLTNIGDFDYKDWDLEEFLTERFMFLPIPSELPKVFEAQGIEYELEEYKTIPFTYDTLETINKPIGWELASIIGKIDVTYKSTKDLPALR